MSKITLMSLSHLLNCFYSDVHTDSHLHTMQSSENVSKKLFSSIKSSFTKIKMAQGRFCVFVLIQQTFPFVSRLEKSVAVCESNE